MNSPSPLIGIDLGGTKIEIIALDQNGDTLHRSRIATPKHDDSNTQYTMILDSIYQLVSQYENQIGQSALPVGIGIPGAVSPKTGKIKNANTTCLIGQDFKSDLSGILNRDIQIENDANCFALSEAIDGAGKGAQSVFGVILGTGVGGGIVINQQVLIGANAITGEWGHNPLPWSGEHDLTAQACYCGKIGCIETYLSGPGLMAQAKMECGIELTSHEIFDQRHTNSKANDAYSRYVDRLARALASVINIVDPDVIVLGGGLSNQESLYQDIPQIWEKYAFSDGLTTRLVKNQFGDSSGVRGAAWLNQFKRD